MTSSGSADAANGGAEAAAAPEAVAGSTEAAAAADRFKDQGNVEHRSGNHLKAAALYTQGLKADPGNAVLFRWHAGWQPGLCCGRSQWRMGGPTARLSSVWGTRLTC